MWLSLLVLFAALSPGILFTAAPLGKKMGGKLMTAVVHGVLFMIVANLFALVEGFQKSQQTIFQRVLSAIGAGGSSLAGNTRYLGQINARR
jgi:hypothetical protein